MLNFSGGEEATDEKMRIVFLVCHSYNNWVVQARRRICASTKTCDWPFNHFQSRRQCVLGAGHEILYVAKGFVLHVQG